MIGTSPDKVQRDAFRPLLSNFIDPDHRLVLLADAIDWSYFQSEFEAFYSAPGQPAMPIQVILSILENGLGKRLSNKSLPTPSGCILNGGRADKRCQENNTPFPTDAQWAKKVIDSCNRIAIAEGVNQRQSYVRVSKQLLRDSYNDHRPRRAKKTRKARKKLRTIAGQLTREA